MAEDPLPRARFFTLVVASFLYASAALVHLAAGPDYLWGTGILATLGTLYLGLFLFGSAAACDRSLQWASLVSWW